MYTFVHAHSRLRTSNLDNSNYHFPSKLQTALHFGHFFSNLINRLGIFVCFFLLFSKLFYYLLIIVRFALSISKSVLLVQTELTGHPLRVHAMVIVLQVYSHIYKSIFISILISFIFSQSSCVLPKRMSAFSITTVSINVPH